MFKLTGIPTRRRKVVASITWDNGRVSGDSFLVAEAIDLAKVYEGKEIGFPSGPKSITQHLKDPYGAPWILSQLFRPESVQVSGEIPAWPEIPANAVA